MGTALVSAQDFPSNWFECWTAGHAAAFCTAGRAGRGYASFGSGDRYITQYIWSMCFFHPFLEKNWARFLFGQWGYTNYDQCRMANDEDSLDFGALNLERQSSSTSPCTRFGQNQLSSKIVPWKNPWFVSHSRPWESVAPSLLTPTTEQLYALY